MSNTNATLETSPRGPLAGDVTLDGATLGFVQFDEATNSYFASRYADDAATIYYISCPVAAMNAIVAEWTAIRDAKTVAVAKSAATSAAMQASGYFRVDGHPGGHYLRAR